ncbi:DUF2232 domain-containing protein, partial [Staphylococcus epidermidis]|uniref:DUF2232 domain-containing protein n=1 Tax=Staphylococcus epidermidis TaxID=1282 RepID=UPI0021B17233
MFKPLFPSQINPNLLSFYLILLISVIIPTQPTTFQTILLNFHLLLSLLIYIQPLTLIHFFPKPKTSPNFPTIVLILLGTLVTPGTHILGLLRL